jgi:biotin carboxyl carrier protein
MSVPTRSLLLLWSLLAVVPGLIDAAEPPLLVAEAKMQTLPVERILDGVVEAVNQSTVSAQTAGRVEDIMVDVNDFVLQGAPIIRLRNVEQRAGLDQAQANLREAQARFLEAQAEYNRIRGVYEKQLVSRAQMDTATAALDAAKARLEAAQAGVAQAKESLGYTTVNAPYSGIVLQRHVQLGETVQPGKPLMTGFSLDELRVVANVPQRLIVPVRQYKQARVYPPNGGTGIPAEKLTFFPYADPAEQRVQGARLPAEENRRASIPACSSRPRSGSVRTIGWWCRAPRWSQRGEVSGVYVVKDAKVSLRQVRPAGSRARSSRSWRVWNRASKSRWTRSRRVSISRINNSGPWRSEMSDATEPRLGLSGAIARKFLLSEITPLLALVGLLLGVFAVLITPREEEPQINVTFANVFIAFPGATAREVERLVSSPAEQMLGGNRRGGTRLFGFAARHGGADRPISGRPTPHRRHRPTL